MKIIPMGRVICVVLASAPLTGCAWLTQLMGKSAAGPTMVLPHRETVPPGPSPRPEPPKPEPQPEPEPAPLPPPAKETVPVARAVPGKAGFVFSPFNNKLIDVEGIPSGRLVADPHYPASEKKYFRVP